ncbi:MAG: ATPase, T2SS/T4P/T4SS family [Verrucomicrobiae bacterium]|nr:ATPase, T2SS/T4P/T4SS family [Verrucomicrobiae bacterium]
MTAVQMMDPHLPAPECLGRLLSHAEKVQASDIHLLRENGLVSLKLRLDGVLVPAGDIHGESGERLFGRIKYLARLKTYEDALPQDGRIDRADAGIDRDVRVSTYPTVNGEKIVLRLFCQASVRKLDELDFPRPAAVASGFWNM